MKQLLGLVLAALLSVAALVQHGAHPTIAAALEDVERLTTAEFARDRLGSVTVGVISGPDLIWVRSFGLADVERRIPATPDTVYRIGSMTKPFTGLMLLQLVEAGKVHLSEAVEEYFPEINLVQGRQPWYPATTFVQLATMTSGIDREPANPFAYATGSVAEWEKALIGALPRVKYVSEPDTRYLSSNISYAVLGAALARVARVPYMEYVKQRILAPLGMTRSGFELDEEMRAALAKGYGVGDDGALDPRDAEREHAGRGYRVPNGGLYSTASDLARFVSFELGEGPDAVLSRRVWIDNLSRTNSSMLDLRAGYGIGFLVNRRGSVVTYGHGGDVAGYSAAAQFDRTSRVGVVVLSNVSGGRLRTGPLADRLLEIVAAAAK
jgi:CubicO group peptidase (beta-lactamase class C family)